MKPLRYLSVLAFVLMGSFGGWEAQAAVTCTASVTSIVKGYDPNATGDTVATGSYTVSCTRLASDPNTFNWQLGADNGQQPSGAQNRVQLGANRYSYEIYRLTPYVNGNRWQDAAATRFTGTINFGAGLIASQSGSFDLRLTGPQTVRPAGTYTDVVTVTVRNGSGTMLSQTTFSVSIITIASCTLSTPPGNINLAYTSRQVAAASASTTFKVNCTTGIPYTMALDATSGTLVGLNYTVALSLSASNGTGAAQTFSINGSIAGGQSGTCATATCSASATRTLTVTY
jgi:spore coat protein U-like protein